MRHYWFKAKQYGWGWYPASWQGFTILAVYLIYIIYRALSIQAMFDTWTSVVFRFIFELIPPTIILLVICYLKGEKPSWRWGYDQKKSKKS